MVNGRLRVLILGELTSVHVQRWVSALAGDLDIHVAGFGDIGSVASCTVHHLGDERTSGDVRFLIALPSVMALRRRLKPHVVHAHYLASYGVLAAFATAGGRAAPVVQSAWGSDVLQRDKLPDWHRRLMDRAVRGSVAVTYDSEDVAQAVARMAPQVPRQRVLFGPPAAWTTPSRRDERVILAPRLPLELYRPDVQIRSFAALDGDGAGWELEILSAGHDVSALESLSTELGVRDRVRFRPILDRTQMLEAYLRCPVTISIPRSDATAASLLEAMATGSFPVVSDLPANRQLVIDGVNGLVVPVDDVPATTVALRRAIADRALRARAADANRGRVAREATWEKAVQQVIGIYRQAAQRS